MSRQLLRILRPLVFLRLFKFSIRVPWVIPVTFPCINLQLFLFNFCTLLAIEELVINVAFRHSSSVLLYEEKEHFQKSSEPAKSDISIFGSGVLSSLVILTLKQIYSCYFIHSFFSDKC